MHYLYGILLALATAFGTWYLIKILIKVRQCYKVGYNVIYNDMYMVHFLKNSHKDAKGNLCQSVDFALFLDKHLANEYFIAESSEGRMWDNKALKLIRLKPVM